MWCVQGGARRPVRVLTAHHAGKAAGDLMRATQAPRIDAGGGGGDRRRRRAHVRRGGEGPRGARSGMRDDL